MKSFAERLREKRRAAGKGQADVATAIGMSRTGYAEIEHGVAVKTFAKLPAIAKCLGCRIDDLFPEMDALEAEMNVSEGKTVCADGFAGGEAVVSEDENAGWEW